MKRINLTCSLILVAGLALSFRAPQASARSLLEGLELVESDKGGVEILSVTPNCPAAKADLRVGDRIVEIDGRRISGLDDYVRLSRKLKEGKESALLQYYRDGARNTVEVSLYSAPILEKWGLRIATSREAPPPAELDHARYWLRRARGKTEELEMMGDLEVSPEDHAIVIQYLFSALESDPGSVNTASLIARQYGDLASLYNDRGRRKKAVWCLRRALLIYGNSIRKVDSIQDMAAINKGLKDLSGRVAELRVKASL